jgi:hypothetical protein
MFSLPVLVAAFHQKKRNHVKNMKKPKRGLRSCPHVAGDNAALRLERAIERAALFEQPPEKVKTKGPGSAIDSNLFRNFDDYKNTRLSKVCWAFAQSSVLGLCSVKCAESLLSQTFNGA